MGTSNATTRQPEQSWKTNAQDACSAKVTNKHSKPMCLAPKGTHVRQHPFVDGIMETPCPKGRGVCTWTNTTVPLTLMNTLQTISPNNEDAILCQIFLTSLKGYALRWYT
ncbi:hypothetical protein CR513_36664, partial [Mucuna pruriens]